MEAQIFQTPFTNIQVELLKLYARKVSDADLIAIKQLLAHFFAEKAMDAADKLWDEKGWTNENMERLANTHFRTPYLTK
jgi:hypothetical protein